MALPASFLQLKPTPLGNPVSNAGAYVQSFEQKHAMDFSELHREILVTYSSPILFGVDCAYRPLRRSPWDGKDGSQTLEALYGLGDGEDSLELVYLRLQGRMPPRTFAIGASSGGNQVCLCFAEAHAGHVYFWDHEQEVEITGAESDFSNMYLISETFNDFILGLFPRSDEVGGSDLGINESKTWLDF